MKKNKDKVINLLMTIIIFLLIAFIIYLLLKEDGGKTLRPSGNVDIFEINCNLNCNCDDSDDTKPTFGENGNLDGFDVLENGVLWDSNRNLNIFANPMYEFDNKIAPESTNFYQFVIKNNTSYNVNYNINFEEVNNYQINMKYRLIKNNDYVIGDENNWVSYDELNLNNILIKSKNYQTYYLEWRWFGSDNDTAIGEAIDANYELRINIKAVQI